jgi:transposase
VPRRAMPSLSPEMRAILERDLAAAGERERQAALDKYVLVAAAYEAGMTVRDIAAVYDASSATATRWKQLGVKERARRQGAAAPAEEEH